MTMRTGSQSALAGLLGVAVALLASCGGSGGGLIPKISAEPLKGDFETVAQAAQSGDCAATATAIRTARHDFAELPSSVNAGLRNQIGKGLENLATRALAVCAQPLPQATSTTTTPSTTTTRSAPTTPTVTQTTPTETASTPTTTAPPGPGGGTPAPTPTTPSVPTPGGGEAAPGSAGEQGRHGCG